MTAARADVAAGSPMAGPTAGPVALRVLEWGLLAAAVGLWVSTRSYTPLIAVGSGLLAASWIARWLATRSATRPTAADFPLLLFLISALAGLWAAPNQGAALVRLFLFVGAAGLYYGVVNATGSTLSRVCAGLTLVAAAVGVYFVTQNPWAEANVKFGAVHQAGLLLNGWVPDLGGYKPHPNVVAGLLGVLAPLSALQTWAALRQAVQGRSGRGWLALLGSALVLALIAAALLMTESRATWLALAGAGALGVWWWLAGRLAGGRPRRHLLIFFVGVMLGAGAAAAGVGWQAERVARAFGTLPGPNSAISRVEVFRQVWRLAQATPFTGGGLDTFPALYSTYVLDIPFLLLTHAHNAYLNLLVEQGWPGVLGYGLVLATAAAAGLRCLAYERPGKWQRAAGLLGLAVIAIQSLGDASLVASRVTPVIFVPAALALADPAGLAGLSARWTSRLRWAALAMAGLAIIATVAFNRQLTAAWQADLGSVAFARAQLANWPTNEWQGQEAAAALAPAETALREALTLNPDNRAVRLRLGAGALARWDFPAAASYLEPAHAADPNDRGLTKYLAYTYVWLADYRRAKPLLKSLPEAAGELEVYTWWWGVHGHDDLAERARHALAQIRPAP
ncbi:MAG: O-antigen ligase family protein [Anaerolineales bacterium]